MTPKSLYEDRIRELAPDYDPRHIEAFMRIEHGTLDGLSFDQFAREVRIACDCIDQGGLEMVERNAISMGFMENMPYKKSSLELHDRIRAVVPDHDPVHVEAYFRLRNGVGSERVMPDHQFAEAVREAADRVVQAGPVEAERFAKSSGFRPEPAAEPDTKPGNYYVTVRRGDDKYLCLAGPFRDDHKTALSLVDKVLELAIAYDRTSIWDGFGTARFSYDHDNPGFFNEALGLDAQGKPVSAADEEDEEVFSPGM